MAEVPHRRFVNCDRSPLVNRQKTYGFLRCLRYARQRPAACLPNLVKASSKIERFSLLASLGPVAVDSGDSTAIGAVVTRVTTDQYAEKLCFSELPSLRSATIGGITWIQEVRHVGQLRINARNPEKWFY